MPRLFISHSSVDNVLALAFQRWLIANGWDQEDVFIDLHGIGAGERWRDTLRKANASCEAVILLASPDSLDSKECQREINLAEDLGKPILVVILRDLGNNDGRLARFADTQFVNLSAEPLERMEPFEHLAQVHRVSFNLAALLSIKRSLEARGIAPGSFAWAPRKLPDGTLAGPYPGLAAFSEDDAGIFFGREAEIATGLAKLRQMRRRRSPRVLVIQAASGAGKSSYLRAGLWPRLARDPDYIPLAVLRPALGVLTGPDGFGRRFAPWLEKHGRKMAPADIHARIFQGGDTAIADLIADAAALATSVRRAGMPDARPPAPVIAIDQGEELFAPENAAESERLLAMLASLLKAPPIITSGRAAHGANDQQYVVDPYVLLTIRADSVEALWQRLPALGLDAPETLPLLPLAPDAYRDIILKPASVYSSRVRPISVEPELVAALARNTSGADALPLLAFTLERLFGEAGTDGNLTLARYEAMGGIEGSIDRALAEAQKAAGAAGSQDNLRRLLIPGLATWDPAANAAKRLVPNEADIIGGDRANLAPLANALVEKRLLTRGAGTLEVAHEALLRRPLIDGWLQEQKDALKLRDDVLREAKEWDTSGRHADGLVRRGERLQTATALAASGDFKSALAPASDYLKACRKLERSARSRARWTQAAIYTLLLGIIGGMAARMNEDKLKSFYTWATVFRGHQLAAADLAAKKPGDAFFECVKTFSTDRTDGKQIPVYCPEMVVVPAGSYRVGDKDSKRIVNIAQPFAVSRFTITFDQWDACVAGGGCEHNARPSDQTWGRGSRPAINVDWRDAQTYVAWLNRMAGTNAYRLLSEAEWEYAARAVPSVEAPHPDYPWGDNIGKGNANCSGCGSQWDGKQTAPVGSFKPNPFGLYDMHGNVWQWVEDCYAENLDGVPTDGTVSKAACKDDTSSRVVRGGSWFNVPDGLRSSGRSRVGPDLRSGDLGFRVARVLSPARTL